MWINGEEEGEALRGPQVDTPVELKGSGRYVGISGGGRERRMRENESVNPRKNSEKWQMGNTR